MFVNCLEAAVTAARKLLEGAIVQAHQQVANGGIEFRKTKEFAISQNGDYPHCSHSHCGFYSCLILRLSNTSWYHSRAEVARHMLKVRMYVRFVWARFIDSCSRIIGNNYFSATAKVGKSVGVPYTPCF